MPSRNSTKSLRMIKIKLVPICNQFFQQCVFVFVTVALHSGTALCHSRGNLSKSNIMEKVVSYSDLNQIECNFHQIMGQPRH